MRVVHISSADNRGGAARSAYRLHQTLNANGVESRMFVKTKFTNDDSVMVYEQKSSSLKKLIFSARRKLETGNIGYLSIDSKSRLGFAPATSPSGLGLLSQLPKADIYNLHWVSAFMDFRLIPQLASKCRAVVWRFSDMSPFTGGCFYDNNCGRYTENCGCCPCLNSTTQKDLSYKSLKLKKQIIKNIPAGFLHIVAQSRWMEKCIKDSNVFGETTVTRIPNGININRFSPHDRQMARRRLGLPLDHKVITFIAQSLTNPMKGAGYFVEAMRKLATISQDPILALVIGDDNFPEIEGVKLLRLTTSDDEELNLAYSAGDVFVITSLQDNLPNTVLEAMACGSPVVGFEIGGIPDMVKNGKTGFLVPAKHASDLADKILSIISNESHLKTMSANGRERVVAKFSVEAQAKSYIKLYQDLLTA